VSLVEEGVDVAVRAATRLPDSSVVARKIGEIDHGLFASPRCLESRGTPASPADLAAHRCIVFRGKGLTKTWKLHDDVVGVDIVPSATHVPSRVTAFRDHVAAAFRAWASSSR
jgi:DNA-binding transcriptional LysR family regulator